MAIRATSHTRRVKVFSPGGMRRFVGLSMAALLGGMAFGGTGTEAGGAANAARVCGERDVLLEQLAQQHDETPRALGLADDGGVIEVLVSPEGGWTMLVTYPDRPTCVVAIGKAWQMLQLAGKPV